MDVAGKTASADTGNLPVSDAARQPNPRDSAATPTPASGDKVVLSPRAREILESRKAAAALPDIRPEVVDRVRRDIASGTYVIQQDRIAVRMMHESLLNQMV